MILVSASARNRGGGTEVIVRPTFFIPPEIEAGLLSGDLIRYGGVVRDSAGRLVTHLKEIAVPKGSEEAAAAAVSSLKNPVVLVVAIVGAVAATATAVAVTAVRRRKAAVPECVENYNKSLRAYLEAVRLRTLDAEIVDRLIADLDAVKEYSKSGSVTVDFSTEQSETLVQLVVDYTQQLADANSVDLESPEPAPESEGGVVVDLRRYLEVQKRIFSEGA
jgi:hypothetical protein